MPKCYNVISHFALRLTLLVTAVPVMQGLVDVGKMDRSSLAAHSVDIQQSYKTLVATFTPKCCILTNLDPFYFASP